MNSLRYQVLDPDGIAAPNGGTLPQNNLYSYEQLTTTHGFTAAAIAALIQANRLSDLTPLEPSPIPVGGE